MTPALKGQAFFKLVIIPPIPYDWIFNCDLGDFQWQYHVRERQTHEKIHDAPTTLKNQKILANAPIAVDQLFRTKCVCTVVFTLGDP